jgi:hypothetical protein
MSTTEQTAELAASTVQLINELKLSSWNFFILPTLTADGQVAANM